MYQNLHSFIRIFVAYFFPVTAQKSFLGENAVSLEANNLKPHLKKFKLPKIF